MSGPPPIPQVIRIDLDHHAAPDPVAGNRTYWRYTGSAPIDADMNTLANTVQTAWGAHLAALCSTAIGLTEVVVTDMTSDTAGRGVWSGLVDGTRVGQPLPIGACTLVNFQIQRRYRGGKPRAYLPYGVTADQADNTHWGNTYIGLVNTAWTAYAGALQGAVFGGTTLGVQVNASLYEGVYPPVTMPSGRVKQSSMPRAEAVVDNIIGHSCNSIIGNQRRRYRPG